MNEDNAEKISSRMPWWLFWIISRLLFFGTIGTATGLLGLLRATLNLSLFSGIYSLVVAYRLYTLRPKIASEAIGCFIVLFWCDILIVILTPFWLGVQSPSVSVIVPAWLVAIGDAIFCWWANGTLARCANYFNTALPSNKFRISLAGLLMTTLVLAALINTYQSDLRRHPFSRMLTRRSAYGTSIQVVTLLRRLPWGLQEQHLVHYTTQPQRKTNRFPEEVSAAREMLLEKTDRVLFAVDGKREWLNAEFERYQLQNYLQCLKADELPSATGFEAFLQSKP